MANKKVLLLKIERVKKNLTQEAAAEKIGVDIRTYGRWERGETEPEEENKKKLAALFNMNVEVLDEMVWREKK